MKEKAKKIIRDAGLRATEQRICLLDLLLKTKKHPSAETLIQMVQDTGYEYSLGTIYNTLNCFEEKGIVQKVRGYDEVIRYDARTDFHVHMVTRKGEIVDVMDSDALSRAIGKYIRDMVPEKANVNYVDVTLYLDDEEL